MGQFKRLAEELTELRHKHYAGEVKKRVTIHAWERFYQRYGQVLTRQMVRQICNRIKASEKSTKRHGRDFQRTNQHAWSHGPKSSSGQFRWSVLVDGIGLVRLVYCQRTKRIITFTPRETAHANAREFDAMTKKKVA